MKKILYYLGTVVFASTMLCIALNFIFWLFNFNFQTYLKLINIFN